MKEENVQSYFVTFSITASCIGQGEAGLCGGDLCGSSDIWRADGTIHGKTFVRV